MKSHITTFELSTLKIADVAACRPSVRRSVQRKRATHLSKGCRCVLVATGRNAESKDDVHHSSTSRQTVIIYERERERGDGDDND